jgi:hypothetical protein
MGQGRGDGEFGLRKFTGSKSSGYLQKKKIRFSFFAVTKIKNIYLHSVLKESGFREFSSAGSEHSDLQSEGSDQKTKITGV